MQSINKAGDVSNRAGDVRLRFCEGRLCPEVPVVRVRVNLREA
jgi:hypothetical protein